MLELAFRDLPVGIARHWQLGIAGRLGEEVGARLQDGFNSLMRLDRGRRRGARPRGQQRAREQRYDQHHRVPAGNGPRFHLFCMMGKRGQNMYKDNVMGHLY